jgi:hypothetical protein
MDGGGYDSSALDTGFRLWAPPRRIKKLSTWENRTFLLIEVEQEQWEIFRPRNTRRRLAPRAKGDAPDVERRLKYC